MPSGLNEVIIGGHLGRDAEIRFTKDGSPWASFTVCVSEKYKNRAGETVESQTWVGCKWWSCYENAGEWLTKCRGVIVTGKLATNSYENKEGKKVTTLEVKVTHCYPHDNTWSKRGAREPQQRRDHVEESDARYSKGAYTNAQGLAVSDEDCPF